MSEILDVAKNGNLARLKDILEVEPNALFETDEAGMSTVHKAACYGHADILIELLDHWNVDPNVCTHTGKRPLHFAAWKDHKDACLVLLDRGADPDATDGMGMTALYWATSHEATRCIRLLKERMSTPHAPIENSSLGEGARKVLQEAGVPGSEIDEPVQRSEGVTPLIMASFNNNIEIFKILLADASDSDINAQDCEGYTSLHWACWHGNEEMAKMLIDRGCDVNKQNSSGWTPLDFARTRRARHIEELLLQKGARFHGRKTDKGVFGALLRILGLS